jgi:mannitol/fructose-specific phosphotransferase system IIA component (Ntr-type)
LLLPASAIKIRTLVEPRAVLELPSVSKNEALGGLCKALAGDSRVLDGGALYEAILQRERQASTGIGQGLAFPHVKIPQVTDFILAIGRSREGVEFGAPDRQPVHLIFLLAASNRQVTPFIHVLSRLAAHLKQDGVRQELLGAENPAAITEICKRYDW